VPGAANTRGEGGPSAVVDNARRGRRDHAVDDTVSKVPVTVILGDVASGISALIVGIEPPRS
jgi:hypothetical protein